MKPTKDDVARQFGRMSAAYADSPTHAHGSDLGLLLASLDPQPHMDVLDVATGAGHTAAAAAPFVRHVTAIDLAPEMIERTRALAAARALANIEALVMDVEALVFPDASFDAVTCRIAPHHFLDPVRALREMARVLRPDGRFALEDSCAPTDPALDRFLNHAEMLRDPTHVRSYTQAEWEEMVRAAGLTIAGTQIYRKTHDFADWLERAGPDAATAEAVHAAFAAAPPAAQQHFEIRYADGRVAGFTDDKLILRADKPTS